MRPWSHAEEEALRILSPLGGPACAAAFDRSHGSVRHRASALHVSLRRRGFGTRLGQCGPAVLRTVREASQASLCPACAMRPQAVASTGLCGVCHKENLIAGHNLVMREITAQREYDASKQRMKRLRDAGPAVSVARTGDGRATLDTQVSGDAKESACTR